MLAKLISKIITKYDWDGSAGPLDLNCYAGNNISGGSLSYVTHRDQPNELRTTLGLTFESEHLIAAAGEANALGELVVQHKINDQVVEHKLSADKAAAIRAHQQLQADNRAKRRQARQVQPQTVDVMATAA